jgi:hypothetical protein
VYCRPREKSYGRLLIFFDENAGEFTYTALKGESNYAILFLISANAELISVTFELKTRYWSEEYGG